MPTDKLLPSRLWEAGYDAEIFEEEEEFCLQMQNLQGLQNPLQNDIHGLFQNAKLL